MDRISQGDSAFSNLSQFLFQWNPPLSQFLFQWNAFLSQNTLLSQWNAFLSQNAFLSRWRKAFLSQWNAFLSQWDPNDMSGLLTSTGYKYRLDTLSNSFPIRSTEWVSIFDGIMDESSISELISQTKWWAKSKWNCILRSETWMESFAEYVEGFVWCEERMDRNNESALLWTLSRKEFSYSILFVLLAAGSFACMHFYLISKGSSELQTELEKIKSLTIPSYKTEVLELLDEYPLSEEWNSFWLKDLFLAPWNLFLAARNLFLAALEQLGDFLEGIWGFVFGGNVLLGGGSAYGVKSIRSKRKYWKIHLINCISIIPNPIRPITFSRNTIHLSRTSKEIYSLLRKRKSVNSDWVHEKIEFWLAKSDVIKDQRREFLTWVSTLTTEKRMDPMLLSLTHPSDHLSKKNFGYQIIEQPGSIYLRYIVDIHQKYLMNYEFNRSCLVERRIFLAHYQTITYSQASGGANSFHFPSHRNNFFSLRLAPSPSRGILVIGSIGIGRSYLVKYLATNSYVPFITVFPAETLCRDEKARRLYEAEVFEHKRIHMDHIPKNFDNGLRKTVDALAKYNKMTSRAKVDLRVRFPIIFQFELAKAMSPCIIWIPSIHDLYVHESHYLSLGLLANYLSRDYERCSTRNILVIASTHIPQKVDPSLIAPNKLNTCIKIRRLPIPEQRKHLFLLSYTKGFHLEKKMSHTNEFGPKTLLVSNARDLGALINEVLLISMIQKKSIIEANTIRLAFHRQTWEFRSEVRPVQDHGILFYQIGRAVVQNVLCNWTLDPLSIYRKGKSSYEKQRDLSEWYFELGRSMKRFTILLYLLSCSAGSVARDLWSPFLPEEKRGITSEGFLENDSHLAHNLFEFEGVLEGSSRAEKDCSQFENHHNRVTLLLRPEPRNPFDMMQNGFRSIVGLEQEEGAVDPQRIEQEMDFFNYRDIVGSPRIWRPRRNLFDCIEESEELGFLPLVRFFRNRNDYVGQEDYELQDYYRFELQDYYDDVEPQKEDSEFLRSAILQYQTRDRSSKEQGFVQIGSQFLWDPPDLSSFVLVREQPPSVSVFSCREFFGFGDKQKHLITSEMKMPKSMSGSWFIRTRRRKRFEFLIHRPRFLRTNSSLYKGSFSFRSNLLAESYQYLSNLFLSNGGRLLDEVTKTLFRKRWLFPHEMKNLIHVIEKGFPIP
uniref:Ycf2 N-terminal domain-containing protein n=1 Tax=Najas flexilis TaxID=29650 RepID=S4TB83_9LILI|nr:putative protein RF21 [Najas flexilis]YP_008378836.1 putative protein RF21 [Najas flexilis]AFY64115.1 putative protein RF21 [Najas flexilis]AFY64116.1 putative protein RF21 [Najas flexilis]